MNINIPNTNLFFRYEVKPIEQPRKNIVAFVEVSIGPEFGSPLFKIRGYNIRFADINGKPVFIVNAPAFRSGVSFVKSFIVEDRVLWNKIQQDMLDELQQENGGLSPEKFAELYGEVDDINL